MASPHVAGVAALIASQFGHMIVRRDARRCCNSTADPMACPPDLSIYAFFPAVDNGAPQECTGGSAVQLVQRPRPGGRAERDHLIEGRSAPPARGPVRARTGPLCSNLSVDPVGRLGA